MGNVRYFELVFNEDYYDIGLRNKNDLSAKNCLDYKEIKMVCDVIECEYNSWSGAYNSLRECKFRIMEHYQNSLAKIPDEIGNAQRDHEGMPMMVCKNFIKRPN